MDAIHLGAALVSLAEVFVLPDVVHRRGGGVPPPAMFTRP
jgi:hypothetical protein